MAIVKYPEYSVEIVVQEGTGEISNATFSATLDPMSTSNMVLLQKKNTNLKPFIWGVSKWGDSAYNYVPNTYKGISTIGSGKNAVITLTFSQPVDHFTLYFDEVAQSMPLSVTVGDKTFSNDDYQFTYSQETTQTTFTITVNEINTINGAEMPLMITGIENRIALDITHRTGLRKLRTGHTYTKDKGKPAYGIISQEGALNIFDFYTEIDDLIELGLVNNKMDIAVKFQDNVVGKYTSDTWTEQQTGLFNVSLNDKLMEWQNIIVPKKYDLEFDKTAKDLYNHLKSMTDLEFVLDTTTDNHLQAIQIKYYYWEESTLWDFTQKLCDLAQLYIYMRNDGKVIVISQHRINELKNINASNPIIIPYTKIDGQPQINRLENNKINSIESNYNLVTYDFVDIHSEAFGIYEMPNLAGTTSKYISNLSVGSLNSQLENYSNLTILGFDIGRASLNRFRYAVYKFGFSTPEMITNGEINAKLTGDATIGTLSSNTEMYYRSLLDTTSETYYGVSELDVLQHFCNLSGSTITSIKDTTSTSYSLGLVIKDNVTTAYIIQLIGVYNPINLSYYFQIPFYIGTITIQRKQITSSSRVLIYGSGNNNLTTRKSEFINNQTLVNSVPIYEYNANQILSNFGGKQTISFRMATDSLKVNSPIYKSILQQTEKNATVELSRYVNNVYDTKLYREFELDESTGEYSAYDEVVDFEDIKVNSKYYRSYAFMGDWQLFEYTVHSIIGGAGKTIIADISTYESISTTIKYDLKYGETLKELDVFQLQKTDGTYDPKIWQISKVEHDVGGSNWLNIEAVEI